MFRGERVLHQVNNIFMTEGIIYFVEVADFGRRNVDANAHINVRATNLDGRGNLSPETTPAGVLSTQNAVIWPDNTHQRCHNQSLALVRLLSLKTKTFVPSFESRKNLRDLEFRSRTGV